MCTRHADVACRQARQTWSPEQVLPGHVQVPLIKLPPRLTDVPTLKQQDGIQITQKFVDIYDTMINQMNLAIKDLPVLTRPAQ